MINPVPTLEQTSGLMEMERYAVFDALHLGDDDPAVVTESGTFSGFTAAGDAFNLIMVLIEVFLDVDFLQHRLVDNLFVADRELQEDWKTPVGLILILTGAADVDVLISIAPVCGKSLVESLRALGDEVELKIRALFHHPPGFWPPCIGIRMEKVGGKAGHDRAILRLQLIVPLSITFDWKP